MSQSAPSAALMSTAVAIVVILITQFVAWRAENRLNPGLIAALGLMIVTLLSLRQRR